MFFHREAVDGDSAFRFFSFFQSQSQGSITLKIIPAVADEDKLKENPVRLSCLRNPRNKRLEKKKFFLINFLVENDVWRQLWNFNLSEYQITNAVLSYTANSTFLIFMLNPASSFTFYRCDLNISKWTFLMLWFSPPANFSCCWHYRCF